MKPLLENIDFELENTMKETTSGIPPWTHVPPKINLDIAKRKKSETAEDVFRSNFNEFRAKFPNYQCIYTDGSKTNDAVAAAAVTPTYSMSKAYNKSNSIFSAELRALILALEYIQTTNHRNYIIFSDSKSSLQALQDLQTSNPLVCRALELHTTLCNEHKNIVFCWLPSHVGIRGNEAADRAAKGALTSAVSIAEVPASDWKPKAVQFVQNIRNRNWEEVQSNKLKEIVPNLKEHQQLQCHNRRDEVVLTRLRIGHSRLTHSFLLKGEPPPECFGCNTRYTLKHILLECENFSNIRRRFYNCNNMYDLFHTVKKETILAYVREIGIYNRI